MIRYIFVWFFLLNIAPMAVAEGKSDYYGLWWNEDRSGIFELTAKEDGIIGITRWGKTPDTDKNNPDPKLRDRDLKGIQFLWGFEYAAKKNQWKNGHVYDPNNGKTYSAKMSLEGGGTTLKMRGYIGISLLGRTAHFERVAEDEVPTELKAGQSSWHGSNAK